jgi:hypothetical protein
MLVSCVSTFVPLLLLLHAAPMKRKRRIIDFMRMYNTHTHTECEKIFPLLLLLFACFLFARSLSRSLPLCVTLSIALFHAATAVDISMRA